MQIRKLIESFNVFDSIGYSCYLLVSGSPKIVTVVSTKKVTVHQTTPRSLYKEFDISYIYILFR